MPRPWSLTALVYWIVVLTSPAHALPERRFKPHYRGMPTLNKRSQALTGNEAPPLNSPRPGDPIITPTGAPAPTVSPWYVAPTTPMFNYNEAVHKALLWYEAQRSGPISTQRLAWRADSCKVCKGSFGEDLSSAWYEAANTMKWGLPLSWTIMQLAFNIYHYESVLDQSNELNQALQTVKWGTDYLINGHINDTTFIGQLGISGIGDNNDIDFSYYLAPETYELWMPQQYWHPALYCTPQTQCGDIVAASATALSIGSIIFRKYNSTYADQCLQHAESLYNFAKAYPGSYNIPANANNTNSSWYAAAGWYPSSSVSDDIALAGVFLYLNTNQSSYLQDAIKYYNASDGQAAWSEESWDSQGGHLHVMLYQITNDSTYLKNFQTFAGQYLPGTGQAFKQTPLGLSFPGYWGTIALVMNACMDMMVMARHLGYQNSYSTEMANFCTQQINYVMGEKGYAYMVGVNKQYPLRLNHISSYNPFDESPLYNTSLQNVENDFLQGLTNNRRIAYGAIPSGPDPNDHYQDDHALYQYSESTQDSSAGIIGLAAGLMDWYGTQHFPPYSDCNLDLGFSHPNATQQPQWPSDDCYHTCNTQNCNKAITIFGTQQHAITGTTLSTASATGASISASGAGTLDLSVASMISTLIISIWSSMA
ncbi:hypothetical protein BZG36_00224 [Bifiguratus adelaidae]|uniref:cellulase n=1 Tax=Bifiguratus adelaidae TaxID=1938954 RepID=A0A261Y8S3_9FUNG|nr:hypothetical protein BZG36_00224 [Bifiguratus adelaidae]